MLRKLYRMAITSWGLPVDVTTAANGIEGLISIGTDPPDLLITDLAMPGMDGFRMIDSLAASDFRDGMEIIVVTALQQKDIDRQGRIPAGIRILPKPVPFADLHEAILSMLIDRMGVPPAPGTLHADVAANLLYHEASVPPGAHDEQDPAD